MCVCYLLYYYIIVVHKNNNLSPKEKDCDSSQPNLTFGLLLLQLVTRNDQVVCVNEGYYQTGTTFWLAKPERRVVVWVVVLALPVLLLLPLRTK